MNETSMLQLLGEGLSSSNVLSQALPAVFVVGAAVTLAVCFAIRNLALGSYRDTQVEGRGSTAIVGMWMRQCFVWGMQPIVRALNWSRLPPAAITALALLLAVGSGAALAAGRMTLGATLFILSGICDFLDGRLARQQGTAGPKGALLDSVVDRYVEVVIFAGIAWYYRDSWALAAVLAAMAGSFAVPYIRARGESLGVTFSNIGLVQRPERFVILAASLVFSPIVEAMAEPGKGVLPHRLLVLGIVALAVTTAVTALQRFSHAQRELTETSLRPRTPFARGSLFRNATAGALATAADFAAVLALVELAGFHPGVATLLGCGIGGVINFLVNRLWAFDSSRPTIGMAARYAFVSASSAGFNAGLVALLLLLPGVPYVAIWWPVRGLVFLLWNYPLHRDYVFVASPVATLVADREDDAAPPSGLIHANARH